MAPHHLLLGRRQSTTRGVTIGLTRSYELLSALVFLGRRRRIFSPIITLSGARPGDRVLDIGCGPGYLTRLAADAVTPGGAAVGIDASPNAIRYALDVTRQDNCTFRVAVAENLDEPDGSFDVVVSSLMVHHLPEDLRPQAFREMFRVLRPGGRLLVADFRPPTRWFGRRVVGTFGGPAMLHNPIRQLQPLAEQAGFGEVTQGQIRPWLHYVGATKPEQRCR